MATNSGESVAEECLAALYGNGKRRKRRRGVFGGTLLQRKVAKVLPKDVGGYSETREGKLRPGQRHCSLLYFTCWHKFITFAMRTFV